MIANPSEYTPTMLALHRARKVRMARFSKAAEQHAFAKLAPVISPDLVPLAADPAKRRQYETAHHPVDVSVPSKIIRIVAREFGMSSAELTSVARTFWHANARFVATGLMLEMTRISLSSIGRRLHRDHTSVIHARDRAAELFAEEAFRNRVDQLKAEIEA